MTVASDLPQYVQGLSRGALLAGAGFLFVAYLVGLAVYRLYLSPIASFPGPKLAALSRWYEFYYEIVLRGKYSDHIYELHDIYGQFRSWHVRLCLLLTGPIIRVAPSELHIRDSAFFQDLFAKTPRAFKDPFFSPRAGNETSMHSTCEPNLHKIRRSALNP
jgi:hypothetical protein